MASNFFNKIENSFMFPSSICVSSGNEPIDARNTCETVEDFQEIADMGMELRYDGLITYETSTKLWKGCRVIDGRFEWETINREIDLSDYAKKDHKHKEYLPEISEWVPSVEMPEGHVWLET